MDSQSKHQDSGRIFTFYSFKGGTGRSMALANVAWILASNGKTVLTVDWDLEAPGLHRYFAPFLADKSMKETDGLIDQLYRYQAATSRPQVGSGQSQAMNWVSQYADIQRYAEPIAWRFQGRGRIDLLGAGRQDSLYGERVNRFDWLAFYKKYGGGAFFEEMFEIARREYDYILIDSRTGVSDTSGICTIQLPDTLAVFYTLNDQSIEGASAVARDALDKRRALDETFGFKVYPVATRIELAEKDKLERRRKTARLAFEPLVDHFVEQRQLDEYFGSIEVLYDPYYAYEEILATVADQPGSRNSVLSSFETLTSYLTDGEITRLTQVSETRREEAKTQFSRGSESPLAPSRVNVRSDVFISSPDNDRATARDLSIKLASFCKVFDDHDIPAGERWEDAVRDGISGSKLVLALIGHEINDRQLAELEYALSKDKRVIPIWTRNDSLGVAARALPELAQRAGFELQVDTEPVDILNSVRRMLGVSVSIGQSGSINKGGDTSDGDSHRYSKNLKGGSSLSSRLSTGLLAVITAASIFYATQFTPTRSENLEFRANSLASHAVQLKDKNPVLSLLLAREAVAVDPNEFAITTLRASLINSPETRRFTGEGRAFVTVKLDQSGDYAVAVDTIGDAFIYNLTDSLADVVLIRKTRDVAWGDVDRAGRPSLIAIKLNGGLVRWNSLDGLTSLGALPDSYGGDFAFSPRGEVLLQLTSKRNLYVWEVPLSGDQPLFDVSGVAKLPATPWSESGRVFTVEGLKGDYLVFSAAGKRLYTAESITSANSVDDAILSGGGEGLLLLAGDASVISTESGVRQYLASMFAQQLEQSSQQIEKYLGPIGRPVSAAWLIREDETEADYNGPSDKLFGSDVLLGFNTGRMGRLSYTGKGHAFNEVSSRQGARGSSDKQSASVDYIRKEPSGKRFLTVTSNQINVYQLDSQFAHSLIGHADKINDIDWQGARIISASQDGTVRVWDPDIQNLKNQFSVQELKKLADTRAPRNLSKDEANKYGVDYLPDTKLNVIEATIAEESQ